MDVNNLNELGSKEGKPSLKHSATTCQNLCNPAADDVHSERRESDEFSRLSSYEQTADRIINSLKNAHLYRGTNWIGCIENVNGTEEEKWTLQIKIRNRLKRFPLTMKEKRELDLYFKDHNVLKKIKRTKEKLRRRKKRVSSFLQGFAIELWESKIKSVAANFGSRVASYFVFLRFLFCLNCFVAILMLVFVSLPQIIPGDYSWSPEIDDYFDSLSTSVLFYGAYSDNNIGSYNRPLAYFLTWIFVNLGSLIVIVLRMLYGYYKNKSVHKGNEIMVYRLFSSWDYSITSQEGICAGQTAIKTEIKELKREIQSNEELHSIHFFKIYITRLVVHFLVLCILAGSVWIIYFVNVTRVTTESVLNIILDRLYTSELQITVTFLKSFIPCLFKMLVKLEKYHPRNETKVNICRTALFYIVTLVSLATSLYTISNECMDSTQNKTFVANMSNCCWENSVGEEIFKLVLLDLLIFLVNFAIGDGLRAILMKCHARDKLNCRDFKLTRSVLDLIYGQVLIWIGLYFSPVLALVAVIKLFITFYCRYIAVKFCYSPSNKIFREARSITTYIFILLIHLFISMCPMIYAITLETSSDCGPYRMEKHVYEILTSKIGNQPNWIEDVISLMSTSTIIIPFITFLGLLALFYKAKTMFYSHIIKKLQRQVKDERFFQTRKLVKKVISQELSMASGLETV